LIGSASDAGDADRPQATTRAGRIVDRWSQLEAFRRANTRSGTTLYSWHVNYRLGALVARPLLSTRATPNQLTLLAMLVNLAASVYVGLAGRASLAVAAVALVGWQLGYALDCADGQLARARGASSPFGAWLDQCADFVSHVAVLTAMAVVLSHAPWMTAPRAAALAGIVGGANLFVLFATSQYNSLLGETGDVERHADRGRRGWLRRFEGLRELTDYGAFALVAALCLPWPHALLVVVVAAGMFHAAAVVGQIALNWRRAIQS
jgi:phosphatidylglycerophosphate synthase